MPESISWRDYVDSRLEATKESIAKNEQAIQEKFAAVSEFRVQLEAQARTYLPRHEYEKEMEALRYRIDEAIKLGNERQALLAQRVATIIDQKQGAGNAWVILAAILGPLVAVLIVIFNRGGGGGP